MANSDRERQERDARLDHLLRKISQKGGAKFLTESEIEWLEDASDQIRKERASLADMERSLRDS